MIAQTPDPPYFAVIFASALRAEEGYGDMAARMEELARASAGFLGMDSARSAVGLTVCYWRSLDDISAWKANVEHIAAQRLGRERWYSAYSVRIARVERAYEWSEV